MATDDMREQWQRLPVEIRARTLIIGEHLIVQDRVLFSRARITAQGFVYRWEVGPIPDGACVRSSCGLVCVRLDHLSVLHRDPGACELLQAVDLRKHRLIHNPQEPTTTY